MQLIKSLLILSRTEIGVWYGVVDDATSELSDYLRRSEDGNDRIRLELVKQKMKTIPYFLDRKG